MPGAQIVINQSGGAGAGSPGIARNDIWVGQVVQLESAIVNTSYAWELLDAPAGSAATIGSPTNQNATITPDLPGTYRIRLVVNGGGANNTKIIIFRVRYDSTGALVGRGWALPAVGERQEEANYTTRGYKEPFEFFFADLDETLTRLEERDMDGDVNTRIEWVLDGTSPHANTGYGGVAIPLTPAGSVPAVTEGQTAPFWKSIYNGANTSCLKTANTSEKPTGTSLTASIWVKLKALTTGANILNKEYRSDGSHTAPFNTFAIQQGATSGFWSVMVSIGSTAYTLTLNAEPYLLTTNEWLLLALTYDGTSLRAYLNGTLCGTLVTPGGALDYGTNGPYGVMGFPNGTTVGSTGFANLVRIEGVVRSAEYLLSYYKKGVGWRWL